MGKYDIKIFSFDYIIREVLNGHQRLVPDFPVFFPSISSLPALYTPPSTYKEMINLPWGQLPKYP